MLKQYPTSKRLSIIAFTATLSSTPFSCICTLGSIPSKCTLSQARMDPQSDRKAPYISQLKSQSANDSCLIYFLQSSCETIWGHSAIKGSITEASKHGSLHSHPHCSYQSNTVCPNTPFTSATSHLTLLNPPSYQINPDCPNIHSHKWPLQPRPS